MNQQKEKERLEKEERDRQQKILDDQRAYEAKIKQEQQWRITNRSANVMKLIESTCKPKREVERVLSSVDNDPYSAWEILMKPAPPKPLQHLIQTWKERQAFDSIRRDPIYSQKYNGIQIKAVQVPKEDKKKGQ